MAGHSSTLIILSVHIFIASVASVYFPNHKYDQETDFTNDQELHEKGYNSVILSKHRNMKPSDDHILSQIRSPLNKEVLADSEVSETGDSEKRLTHSDYNSSTEISAVKIERKSYKNVVTPTGKISNKGYEVTTEKFLDTEPEPGLTPAALNNDVAIALDDEDFEGESEAQASRPEHLNPLVYLDSYGRVHGRGQSLRGSVQGFGYRVRHAETKTPLRHLPSRKASGRVRMQVFRGPSRIVGHKKYAPWGYYVIQPADSNGPHRYPGPPYNYR